MPFLCGRAVACFFKGDDIMQFIDLQAQQNKIREKIDNKKDLFNRKITYEKVDVDKYCPEYIVRNKDKFKEWII